MIEIKEGEGLCEYIKRHNELVELQKEEMSKALGIPAELMGSVEKLRPQGNSAIQIIGCSEFVKKFREGLKGII